MPKSAPAIAFAWGIASLEASPIEDGFSNVVKTIHWTLTATEGDYTASSYGSVAAGSVDPEDFTPYAELTQAQVAGWLESLLDGEQLRASLAEQIAAQKNPPITTPPLPWA